MGRTLVLSQPLRENFSRNIQLSSILSIKALTDFTVLRDDRKYLFFPVTTTYGDIHEYPTKNPTSSLIGTRIPY